MFRELKKSRANAPCDGRNKLPQGLEFPARRPAAPHSLKDIQAQRGKLLRTPEDRDVFAVIANYTLQEMRYIRTGPKTMLETVELEMLRRASLSVRTESSRLFCAKET